MPTDPTTCEQCGLVRDRFASCEDAECPRRMPERRAVVLNLFIDARGSRVAESGDLQVPATDELDAVEGEADVEMPSDETTPGEMLDRAPRPSERIQTCSPRRVAP